MRRIAEVSDEYSNGNLHITTRQDIQIHYVSLDRTPELWAELEQDDITMREACGNTIRNVTASAMAGADPDEPFDVTPYAHAFFGYFLRNPICQDMGRKIKIAISTNGKSPTLAKRLRQWLEAFLPEETDTLLDKLYVYRNRLKGDFEQNVLAMNKLTEKLLEQDD